jgi:hypothetical protein
MRRKALKFNPLVRSAPAPWHAARSESRPVCCSCERPVQPDQIAGCFLPGLVEGALCLECLEMASHELLRQAARATLGGLRVTGS